MPGITGRARVQRWCSGRGDLDATWLFKNEPDRRILSAADTAYDPNRWVPDTDEDGVDRSDILIKAA